MTKMFLVKIIKPFDVLNFLNGKITIIKIWQQLREKSNFTLKVSCGIGRSYLSLEYVFNFWEIKVKIKNMERSKPLMFLAKNYKPFMFLIFQSPKPLFLCGHVLIIKKRVYYNYIAISLALVLYKLNNIFII